MIFFLLLKVFNILVYHVNTYFSSQKNIIPKEALCSLYYFLDDQEYELLQDEFLRPKTEIK